MTTVTDADRKEAAELVGYLSYEDACSVAHSSEVELINRHAEALAEIRSLREKLADAYVELSGKRVHASDCATSSAPALEPGRCDCHEDKEPQT